MSEEKLNIMIGLFIVMEVIQTILIASLIYKNKKSEEVIRTKRIEMDDFEVKVENKELTVKPKK
ncbi:hypothetical protein [Flagellimonas sp.]|uniref:hypothetical protein n=1 Tax=Flagellimonas sp. TaxID=2058762 RepID=UPI003BA8CE30